MKKFIKKLFKTTSIGPITINELLPTHKLIGKKIIITGGSRGIGKAMANKFVAEGADVLITGRNEETLKATAEKINCKHLVLDVTEVEKFPEFIAKAKEMLGGLDCLVNNAGISLHEPRFFDVTPESYDKQFDTNLKGAFFLTQGFIKALKVENKGGSVLFISSETGETADVRPYGLSKAAINSLARGLAHGLVNSHIRVNAIAPGKTATEMTGLTNYDGDLSNSGNNIGRFYLPEEIAETAAFLLSDASSCISGQIIACNNANTVNPRWK